MRDNLSVVIQQHPDALQWTDNSEGAELQCQKDALVSALSNLVNNAFEAIKTEPRIGIAARLESGRLLMTITDNGPGMDTAMLDQVTEPFFTTKSHGTGLGLPVVIAVIRAHQGEFHINSQPGEGTQVALSLPVKG
jgi:two-component system sensor histidine kinase FlrB